MVFNRYSTIPLATMIFFSGSFALAQPETTNDFDQPSMVNVLIWNGITLLGLLLIFWFTQWPKLKDWLPGRFLRAIRWLGQGATYGGFGGAFVDLLSGGATGGLGAAFGAVGGGLAGFFLGLLLPFEERQNRFERRFQEAGPSRFSVPPESQILDNLDTAEHDERRPQPPQAN